MSKLTAVIHIAKAKLGMDEETYRAFLLEVTGKDSCARMTTREQGRVLDELRQRGFRPHKNTHKGEPLVRDPQARKIRALWLAMADEGIVRNRSEKALEAYMRRITGRTLED
ncbi:MAG: regulatory protein GemA, partial [Desulfovibrio sp.]|nr:regulatory protein GemA [Desulfovibrio sp.]